MGPVSRVLFIARKPSSQRSHWKDKPKALREGPGGKTYAEPARAQLCKDNPAAGRCDEQHEDGNDNASSRGHHGAQFALGWNRDGRERTMQTEHQGESQCQERRRERGEAAM